MSERMLNMKQVTHMYVKGVWADERHARFFQYKL